MNFISKCFVVICLGALGSCVNSPEITTNPANNLNSENKTSVTTNGKTSKTTTNNTENSDTTSDTGFSDPELPDNSSSNSIPEGSDSEERDDPI